MTSEEPRTKKYRPPRALIPYIILGAGLIFTLVVAYYLSRIAEAEDQARFKNSVAEIDRAIESKIATYTALLRAGTGLFAASESVGPQDFRRFVERLDLGALYPGVQGIGFSIRLKPEQKDALVQKMRRSGLPDFKIWPDYDRNEYYSIIYLEPLDRRNHVALGFDMFTEPVRRAAMESACDSGLPAASGRVTLVQEIDPGEKQAGFLIYAPVYSANANVSTQAERRAALFGFVYSPFRADDLLADILANKKYNDIQFQIYDGRKATPENLLHDSTRLAILPSSYKPHFVGSTQLAVAGRTWTLNFATRPTFALSSDKGLVPYTVGGGLLLSLLFFAAARYQISARAYAERTAAELRQSGATIVNTLAERARAEEALKESEERYRELVENANDIVYTLDLEGRLTSINKAGEMILGYARDELLNRDLSELMTEDSFKASRQMFERKIAGEERTNYEIDCRAKSGRSLTLEISSRLISRHGELIGVQGIARDITLRKRAEEALREADQRALSAYERLLERISALAQALGSARDLLTIFRSLREFTLVSVPCNGLFVSLYDPLHNVRTAFYGWGDGEEIDVSLLPPMPITSAGPNSRAIRTGQVIITDDYMNVTRGHPAVLVGPDNGLRPQSSLVLPMAVMGRIIGSIEVQSYERSAYQEQQVTAMRMAANLTAVAIEDVRLLERESTARAAAEESNRLKDEFLATVSHELRTPLTAILGWSRMLESGSLDTVTATRAIETIRRNAKSQAQIVDDILDVSRIITGNLYLDLHPIELGPVIEAATNVVRPTAEAKGIQIETELESQPAVISGDSHRLQQVIWNLLSNAIKFTPRGGCVQVRLRQTDYQVQISVTDTGQGIDADFLPYVFDRFRQADSTTTRQHGGLGLGLAIARHLVEIHGGTVEAESPGAGKGASFLVKLPLLLTMRDKVAPSNGENAPESPMPLKGLHVLLVDDDYDTLELLSAALTQRKAKVTAVSSASEAIEAIKTSVPDVLVSDIAMPGEDGYDLIRKVRAMSTAQQRRIPAVAITAYAKDEDRDRALSSGFHGYLAKPVEPAALVSAVADAAKNN